MYPPPVARQAPSTSNVARAIPAAPNRRAMRRRGDSFTIDLSCPYPRWVGGEKVVVGQAGRGLGLGEAWGVGRFSTRALKAASWGINSAAPAAWSVQYYVTPPDKPWC